jgi:hypothetical protein
LPSDFNRFLCEKIIDDSTIKDDRESAIKTNEHAADTAQGKMNSPTTASTPTIVKHDGSITVNTLVKVGKATSELESKKDSIATAVQRKSVVTSKRK